MRLLLEVLATWRGPEEVGKEIAKRGLLVPQAYRRHMIAYCNSIGVASDLETYWSEWAREFVRCGGVNSHGREFGDEVAYRSSYLDRLAAERKALPKSQFAGLHPCLLRWAEEKKRTGGQSARLLSEKLDELKEAERRKYGISGNGWTGKKRGVVPLLLSFAQSRGFEERFLSARGIAGKGKALCKEKPSGLIFYCWVDTGGFPDAKHRLPLYFSVSHVDDTFLAPNFDPRVDESFPPLNLTPDAIYAGSAAYARFKTPEMAVFGIFALVEIFDAFFSTFQ